MKCPNCDQIVEDSAAFCGNCGQRLAIKFPQNSPTSRHIARVLASQEESGTRSWASVPEYAVAKTEQHEGEIKAVVSVLLGALGIVGAFFAALIGLVMGIVGLVFGTLARNSLHKKTSSIGIVASSLAVVVSLGVWSFVIHNQGKLSDAKKVSKTQGLIASADVETPCYATGFIDTLNVANTKDSCSLNAFNGNSLESSTKAYKIYASQIPALNNSTFNDYAKQALEKDVAVNLPNVTILKRQFTNFAGSPAYIIETIDKNGLKITEAIVLRQVRAGANIFVLVQADTKTQADLSTLEAQWQWK